MKTSVPCAACAGTGRRELRAHELATLRAVTRHWSTVDEILERLGDSQSTMLHMRLSRLVSLGLVERRTSERSIRTLEFRLA